VCTGAGEASRKRDVRRGTRRVAAPPHLHPTPPASKLPPDAATADVRRARSRRRRAGGRPPRRAALARQAAAGRRPPGGAPAGEAARVATQRGATVWRTAIAYSLYRTTCQLSLSLAANDLFCSVLEFGPVPRHPWPMRGNNFSSIVFRLSRRVHLTPRPCTPPPSDSSSGACVRYIVR
jgi:hypothetical protein